jgi:hypothetical protein
MPWGFPPVDHILGAGSPSAGPKLVSPQIDEAKIALLMVAVDRMLDRCEETIRVRGSRVDWKKVTPRNRFRVVQDTIIKYGILKMDGQMIYLASNGSMRM